MKSKQAAVDRDNLVNLLNVGSEVPHRICRRTLLMRSSVVGAESSLQQHHGISCDPVADFVQIPGLTVSLVLC